METVSTPVKGAEFKWKLPALYCKIDKQIVVFYKYIKAKQCTINESVEK